MDDEGRSGLDRESSPLLLPPTRRERERRVSDVSAIAPTESRDTLDDLRPALALDASTVATIATNMARRADPEANDEEVVSEALLEFGRYAPGRRLVVRLTATETGQLDLVRSLGPLLPGREEQTLVSRVAVAEAGLSPRDVRAAGFDLVERYEPSFDLGARGFDVALVDGNRLLGVLGVEYGPGQVALESDRVYFVLLGLQLAGAIARARLRHAASYLSDSLGRMLDHANVPILVIDPRRNVQLASEALLRALDRSRNDIVGEDLLEFVSEPDRPGLQAALLTALRGQVPAPIEVGLHTSSGREARVALSFIAMARRPEEIGGVLAIGRDLTEVRSLEEQVAQAEKLATLGTLAAGIVHELNNPLTSISVYSDYLQRKAQRENADPGDVEKLTRIVKAAERILRFTRDLVTYARPSKEEPEELHIHDVLEQSVVFCEHTLAEVSAHVEKRYASSVPLLLGVRDQLHQVFINLITNACHAMPDGAGQLLISTEVAEHYVLVHVEDNGSGIPADQLPQVFEPFFSTKGQGKGTGLGLSIVRNLVRTHGGTISVESAPGRGATFTVMLPTL